MLAEDLIGEGELRAEGRERVCACANIDFGGGAEITCAPDNSVALQINFRPFKRDTCG